jgi:hypothetical protein
MSQLPHQKAYHDSLVSFILVLSGKSSWVPSRTQGFVPTCCRWADVLWLLYQLPLSCDGRSLGLWAMVIHYISSDAFVGRWFWVGTVFWTLCTCVIWTKCFRYFHSNWFVITMFKLRCICDANFYVTCVGDHWTYYDLGWYVSWFEIRRDFMDYRVIRA